MDLKVKRWNTRRLLYPIAVFAIIAPTVIMGLFGAYALREIELRPSQYRQELREVQTALEIQVEARVAGLRVTPPATEEDVARTGTDVHSYLSDYNRAFARQCYYGIGGRIRGAHSVDGTTGPPAPPVLVEMLVALPKGGQSLVNRQSWQVMDPRGQTQQYVIFNDTQSGGFVAWELNPPQVEQFVTAQLQIIQLENDALSLVAIREDQMDWRSLPTDKYESLGYVPVHRELLPGRYVELKLDTSRQFYKDSKLLSSIFVVIAVLCVPIVASATLMVVHMILREASEARKKVDFVSNVTHELKTPLTSIRMFVETLKLGRVKSVEQQNACLDVIMSETDRLGALIDHVLSFSKVENQVKKYNFQLANLPTVVRDTISLFKAQMKDTDGEIRLKILPGVPSEALLDKDAVREVLLNLLSNAIKYSGDDKFVTVMVGMDRNDLFIEVADRGIGIPAEDQQRIFEKFYRVDQALSRKVDGTGLGLAICKEIVQAHDGRIVLESVWGKGSRFTVFIPYKRGNTRRKTGTQAKAASTRETRVSTQEMAAPKT